MWEELKTFYLEGGERQFNVQAYGDSQYSIFEWAVEMSSFQLYRKSYSQTTLEIKDAVFAIQLSPPLSHTLFLIPLFLTPSPAVTSLALL